MALWLDQGVVSVLISLASDISSIEGNCFFDLERLTCIAVPPGLSPNLEIN